MHPLKQAVYKQVVNKVSEKRVVKEVETPWHHTEDGCWLVGCLLVYLQLRTQQQQDNQRWRQFSVTSGHTTLCLLCWTWTPCVFYSLVHQRSTRERWLWPCYLKDGWLRSKPGLTFDCGHSPTLPDFPFFFLSNPSGRERIIFAAVVKMNWTKTTTSG